MHALTLARQRIRARIQSPSTPQAVRLAHGLAENGQGRFIPVLSSALAQDILSRGYDARTLDRVYANRVTREFGLMGRLADRIVLDLPVHHGLRERFEATVGEVCGAIVPALRRRGGEFRALCAPCGLANEMVEVARRLQERHPELLGRVRFWGVDLDPDGHLLPEAKRRTRDAGLDARFVREDLRRHREVRAVVEREGPFHLVSCAALSQTLPLPELAEQVRFYTGLLDADGTLLIDRWQAAGKSHVAAGLGIEIRCDREKEFHAMLRAAGLEVAREHPTGEGGCVLVVCRKAGAVPEAPRRTATPVRELVAV